MEVLVTIHGSHLYGLAHADSDYDTFVVLDNRPNRVKARYARQKITDTEDSLTTDLSTFMLYATKGVPQYLEAMWSQQCSVDLIHDMRMNFQPDLYETERTYVRTIRNFWEEGSFKRKRHAHRLYLNLESMRETGKFNPTLTWIEVHAINGLTEADAPPPVEGL